MAILKSNKDWKCRALFFSGRENPEWVPEPDALKEMIDWIEAADAYEDLFEIPSILGYSGVQLVNNLQTVTAFKGKMEISSADGSILRTDRGRQLEQMILKTAPEPFKKMALNQLLTDFD